MPSVVHGLLGCKGVVTLAGLNKLNAALVWPMVTLLDTAKLNINILNVTPHAHVKVI